MLTFSQFLELLQEHDSPHRFEPAYGRSYDLSDPSSKERWLSQRALDKEGFKREDKKYGHRKKCDYCRLPKEPGHTCPKHIV